MTYIMFTLFSALSFVCALVVWTEWEYNEYPRTFFFLFLFLGITMGFFGLKDFL